MNTITESIPTVFNPETAFVLSLQNADDKFNRADEAFTPRRFALPTDDGFAGRGIPESGSTIEDCFGMALVTFTCGFTVMWTYRHYIPGYVPATM